MDTSNIQIVPLDFDTIQSDLKRYLQAQTEFKDYNFEGSALSLLIDILSYDAYYHGWYTNFAVNEVFLQTAQIRNSVVAAARQLGYIPRSVTSSTAEVDIAVYDINSNEGVILLPKYSAFSSTVSGKQFTFYTTTDTVAYPNQNTSVVFRGVQLREGTKLIQTYLINSDNYSPNGTKLRIFNQNVDTTTISVSVSSSTNTTIPTPYTRATSAVEITPTSNVYFLFETNEGDYEIQFGDGRLGRNLNIGQQVIIQYLDSQGNASTGANVFSYAGGELGELSRTSNVIAQLSNINIPAYGGAPRENIESIKRLAPNIYQAQSRVVTPADARTILLSEVGGIDSLTVWGGEDNDPPVYGKMFLCLKPVNAERFGPTQKANIIKTVLRPKASPILNFEAVDPDYIYLAVDSEIRFSPASTALSPQELHQTVVSAIQQYATQNLGQFGSYFRFSQLSRVIDAAEISIQSNMSSVVLEKKLRVEPGLTSYVLNFANPLFLPATQSSLGGYATADGMITVSSKVGTQTFSHIDESGFVQKFCWVQNVGNTVHVYKTDNKNNITKVKSNVGYVNFETGVVQFTNFYPMAITTNLINELRVQAIPLNSDITPNRSQIILLPESNIRISVVEDLLNQRNTTVGRNNFVGQIGLKTFGT